MTVIECQCSWCGRLFEAHHDDRMLMWCSERCELNARDYEEDMQAEYEAEKHMDRLEDLGEEAI